MRWKLQIPLLAALCAHGLTEASAQSKVSGDAEAEVDGSSNAGGKAAGVGTNKDNVQKKSLIPIEGHVPWAYRGRKAFALSLLKGTYQDNQQQVTQNKEAEQSGIALKGYRFEALYLVKESFELNLDVRRETPDHPAWTMRQTYKATAGWIIPKFKVIKPLFGLHIEQNKVESSSRKRPNVSKTNMTAPVIGLDIAQKIYRVDRRYSIYVAAKYHMANPQDRPNALNELEISLGYAKIIRRLWIDVSVGTIRQSFNAKHEPADDDLSEYSVSGQSSELYGRFALWM